jgi:hypothetical protein
MENEDLLQEDDEENDTSGSDSEPSDDNLDPEILSDLIPMQRKVTKVRKNPLKRSSLIGKRPGIRRSIVHNFSNKSLVKS